MTTVATPTPTAEQYRQLKHYFEGTRTLPQLLATLRSRRVGLGYSIESGQAETRGATGRTLQQQRGPLAFVSEHPTLPLSEVEEAILAWSACGPNGLAHWDIAVHGGFHELVHIAGRTAASPGNSFATDLLVIKDQGAFLYNPGTERERMVEIQGEDDYHKVLDWYRRGMHQILDHRPDVDWGLRAPGAPNASLFGPYQFNVNREGTTWFIPITDIGWLYFSVMLNLFDAWHLYFTGAVHLPGRDLPARFDRAEHAAGGGGDGPWKLDLLWLLRRYPHGSVPRPRQGARVSRRAAERAGAAGIRSPEDLRDGGRQGGDLRPVTAVPRRAGRDAGDDGGEVRAGPDDVQGRGQLDAAAYVDYCVERYGQCPVTFNPMQCNFGAVIHHVDPAFYERYYDGSSVTPTIRQHMEAWH